MLHKYQILANACLFSQLHYSLCMVMHCFKLQAYTTSTSLIHLMCFDVLCWPILICYAGPYWWVMLAHIDMICWSILMCYDGPYWLSKNKWFKKRLTYMFQRKLHNLRVVLSICKVIFFLGHKIWSISWNAILFSEEQVVQWICFLTSFLQMKMIPTKRWWLGNAAAIREK